MHDYWNDPPDPVAPPFGNPEEGVCCEDTAPAPCGDGWYCESCGADLFYGPLTPDEIDEARAERLEDYDGPFIEDVDPEILDLRVALQSAEREEYELGEACSHTELEDPALPGLRDRHSRAMDAVEEARDRLSVALRDRGLCLTCHVQEAVGGHDGKCEKCWTEGVLSSTY